MSVNNFLLGNHLKKKINYKLIPSMQFHID